MSEKYAGGLVLGIFIIFIDIAILPQPSNKHFMPCDIAYCLKINTEVGILIVF